MNCRFPKPNASVRLFCFPWAGGGASFYTAWGKQISEDIEVIGICLAGRENRYKDPCCTDAKETIDWIVKTIHDKYFDKPFAFFGHSMGALLSFLVSLEIKRLYGKEPEHLFLSGETALHSPRNETRKLNVSQMSQMSRTEVIEGLTRLGGTPPELFDNPELMDIYFPPLKADLCMVAQLKYDHNSDQLPPLKCPIDFFDGKDDVDHDIDAWKQMTSGAFTFQHLPGGHFFLKDAENTKKLLNFIQLSLRFCAYEDMF